MLRDALDREQEHSGVRDEAERERHCVIHDHGSRDGGLGVHILTAIVTSNYSFKFRLGIGMGRATRLLIQAFLQFRQFVQYLCRSKGRKRTREQWYRG